MIQYLAYAVQQVDTYTVALKDVVDVGTLARYPCRKPARIAPTFAKNFSNSVSYMYHTDKHCFRL